MGRFGAADRANVGAWLAGLMDRRLPRGGDRLVVCVMAVALVCLLVPASSSAMMRNLSSDRGDTDPCAGTGADGGVLIKHNISKDSPKPVNVALQCSPLMEMPFGILLANDIVSLKYLGCKESRTHKCHVEPPGYFHGGVDRGHPWEQTVGVPYIHGNIAENLRLQQFQNQPLIRDAISGAVGSAATSIVASIVACAVGGIPTLGITCATVPVAIGVAAVAAVGGALAAVISDFIKAQISRISAMADADWFVWSDTVIFWNSFGDITDTWINPSIADINPNPFHTDHIRIGVEYSNVPVGGGPDYFAAKENGAATSNLGASSPGLGTDGPDVLQATPDNDVLQGFGHNDLLQGGDEDDNLDGGAGNDRVEGGAGRDQLVGAPGNDTLNGGPGPDILVGGPGRDTLKGGPGPDWIIDTSGPTLVSTPSAALRARTRTKTGTCGQDYVWVRDGVGDDTVTCDDRRSVVYADQGDRVRSHGRVIRTGPILRLPQH